MPNWQLATEGVWLCLQSGSRAWINDYICYLWGKKMGGFRRVRQAAAWEAKVPEEETTGLSFSG